MRVAEADPRPLRRRCRELAGKLGVRLRRTRGEQGWAWNGASLYARPADRWYDQHSLLHDLCHHQVAAPERRVGWPEWGLGPDPTDLAGVMPPLAPSVDARAEEADASLLTVLWLREWGMVEEARFVW